ncbi:MAG: thiamine pyrophosphate-binding protein [Betaproteobacteria bacterium]|nr:thiamine pyrophosphate-binding protein [Betaproteobacteria bacterium]
MTERPGGEILVASLLAQGARLAFGVPGESYLAVLDALHDVRDRLRFVVCRQEGGAAYMAEAFGKLTGTPGLAFVTRGPGAANAAIGIHTAAQDSTPMIVFVGQVGGDMVDREAFQEVDYRRMFGGVAKWAAQIDRAERIPEYVAHAYRLAMSGRPGPVVLALPEDVLTARAACADPPRVAAVPAAPADADIAAARALLADAQAPLVLVGGSRWDEDACAALAAFAETQGLPVAAAFRRQDLFDNRHPHYAGDVGIAVNPRLAARVRDADVLLVIGERLGEMTTGGYTLVAAPVPRQRLVHVHPSPDELGRVYQPALPICATPGAFLAAMNAQPPVAPDRWRAHTRAINDDFAAWRAPRPVPGAVDLWRIVHWLDERLPADAIVTNGAGNYTTWLHRLYRYRGLHAQLAPYSGAMGYAVPAAIAAKAVHPARTVVSWNGDGCFLMNGQELATAVQHSLAVLFVVIDNGMYGTIRMHQERNYPARVSGTDLVNPDFAALARAYGAHGETVLRTEEFAPAFERALAAGRPALVHVKADPQALTMGASLAALRAQGEAARPGGR